jgi:hypothetical protein
MFTGLGRPYLIRGFKINIPTAAIDATSLTIQTADSAVLHSSATESGTILLTQPGLPDEQLSSSNPNVIGSFQSNAINYIALDYRRVTDTTTIDQTAGWSPSQNLEFQRAVPIARILKYRFVITTSGFGTNLPLYMVKTNVNGQVEWIRKAVSSLFRLGAGGPNPNPQNSYNWGNLQNDQPGANPRREWVNTDLLTDPNPLSVTPGADQKAFDYGDFAITNFKDWMDAIMTRFKEVTGSDYWYFNSRLGSGDLSTFNVWWDAIGSVLTGSGDISYNLVLESSLPSSGKFQQVIEDNQIMPGDVYVEGQQSGTRATVTSYNNSQLVINSLTAATFLYDEALKTRRIYRPILSQWEINDHNFDGKRYAYMKRTSVASGLTTAVDTWSYVTKVSDDNLLYSIVTLNTLTPHSFKVGQFVNLQGFSGTSPESINGVHRIVDATATSFTIIVAVALTGVPAPTGTAALDSNVKHPYSPVFKISNYESNGGTEVKITAAYHNFRAPIVLSTATTAASKIITPTSVSDIRVGQIVEGSAFVAGTRVVAISGSDVEISEAATTTGSVSTTFSDEVLVAGVDATSHQDFEVNGSFKVVDITTQNEIVIDIGIPFASTVTLTNATVEPLVFETELILEGAIPPQYNVTNIRTIATASDKLNFIIGPDTLPPLEKAVGAIKLDGVIARSIVLNPVIVSSITNDGAGNLTVTTASPHGLVSAGPLSFTIFGDQNLSRYIRSYNSVTIVVVNPTQYQILGTGIISTDSYINSGNDQVFSKFDGNPYAGPVQWTGDMIVKGIIGDVNFIIPRTAIVDTTGNNSVEANNYNINGQTGTAYLQDGEVLYVLLERNKIVSNGATFTTAGGNALISTSSIATDAQGNPLQVGDWVKWQDETESQWLKIRTINPTGFTLETDKNQEPDTIQRPPKSGVLVYAKGSYPILQVKKHRFVEPDADVYWIAMRRDNGGRSKVYFRGLEVEAGEVRQISDNSTSNILSYIGSPSEAAINPNYSVAAQGDLSYTQNLVVDSVDVLTRMVTFQQSPERLFQLTDRIASGSTFYNINQVISSRTVIVSEDVSGLTTGSTVQYFRVNRFIQDQDNLTLAIRKEDRQAGHIETSLLRPVYDESVYIQKINLSGTGIVRSGSYVYTGSLTNPTALAWVLHGSADVSESIEGATILMPGGNATVGPNSILVHVLFGTFNNGDGLNQNGTSTGRTVNNPGNPPFEAPEVFGNDVAGVELVLPPNRRTQVVGSGFVVFGTHSYYKQNPDPALTGEELLVIVNDGIRQAGLDYLETFGGPKAKIMLVRSVPPNTRMRFRNQSAYGSAVVAKSGDASLQSAYNTGNTILNSPNRPVEITADDVAAGNTALINRGSIRINGGPAAAGGIFNESGTQTFVIGKETDMPKETWSGMDAVKTHLSHPDSAWKRKTAAQVVTGDAATVVTDSAIQLVEGQAYRIKMSAIARRSDGPLGVSSFVIEGTFYRQGGQVFAAGSPASIILGSSGDGYNYAAAFGIQGTQVVLVVYGSAGAVVQWAVGIDWQSVGLS